MTKKEAKEFVVKCSNCRQCKGAAYQSPPVSYVGSLKGRVLILAQNPGEVDQKSDEARNWWNKAVSSRSAQNDAILMKTWYHWDFETSYGANKLGWLTAYDWLRSGDYCFSNSVRCRTPNNSNPDIEMILNCAEHTRELIDLWKKETKDEDRRLLVLMGAVAKTAFLRIHELQSEQFPNWGIAFKQPSLGTVLPVMHYAAWRSNAHTFRKAFKSAYDSLKD